MSLLVVAIPIGNPKDLTLRALEELKNADLIIGEEKRELFRFLKPLGLHEKKVEFLNEHSKAQDLEFLVNACSSQNVCLISDCGTPGFCDPGADLVAACRAKNISVIPLPGPSSLMTLLSVSGVRLQNFVFLGFLPMDKVERNKALQDLKKEKRPVVLMDTPYRLSRLMEELAEVVPQRVSVLGLNLTQPDEKILTGPVARLKTQTSDMKSEFILLLA